MERALRLYRRILPKEALAGLEEMVRDLLENDPTAVELLAAARPREPRVDTGADPVAGAPEHRAEKPAGEG